MLTDKRRYGLGIWALGLGFYLFYTPYSGLTKALSGGLLTGAPVKGTVLLPISAMATVAGMLGFITVMNPNMPITVAIAEIGNSTGPAT